MQEDEDGARSTPSRVSTHRVLALLMVPTGLAAIDVWVIAGTRWGGVLLGMALLAALMALAWTVQGARNAAVAAWAATLQAVAELALGLVLIMALVVPLALKLPQSLVVRLLDPEGPATDAAVFLLLGIGLLVAARGWSKYVAKSLANARAELELQQSRAAAAEREREVVQSQLLVMQAQIEPHFLWNTLGNVQHLTRHDPAAAYVMLGHLIAYLRASVPRMRSANTTVGSEVESVRAYLELMRMRMGTRLQVCIEVEASVLDQPFAPLLMQTLVENAIKHGLEPKIGPATLVLRARRDAQATRLVLEIVDDGVGLQLAPDTRGTGLGLPSVRDRLKAIYGGAARLSILGNAAGGVTSRIEVPLAGTEPWQE